jgi:hypothetical protein
MLFHKQLNFEPSSGSLALAGSPLALGPEQQASYIIFMESGNSIVKAQNGATGAVDYSATDAGVVIQNVVRSLGSAGGLISIREGTYPISTPIIIPNSSSNSPNYSLIIRGSGREVTTLQWKGSPSVDIVSVDSSTASGLSLFAGFEDLTIDFADRYTAAAINLDRVGAATVRNVYLHANGTYGNTGSIGIRKTIRGGIGSIFDNVRIDNFDTGMLLSDDHLALLKPAFAYCQSSALYFRSAGADNTVIQPHFYHTGAGKVDVLINCAPYGLQACILNAFHEADPAAPPMYHYQINNNNPGDKYTVCVLNPTYNVSEQVSITARSLPYVRFSGSPKGFAITVPSRPAAIGPANAVMNSNPFPVRIYAMPNPSVPTRDATRTVGTHIVDPYGTDVALPADPLEVTLDPGASIYYTLSVPASWKWYGT